ARDSGRGRGSAAPLGRCARGTGAGARRLRLHEAQEDVIGLFDRQLGVYGVGERAHGGARLAAPVAGDISGIAAHALELTLQRPRKALAILGGKLRSIDLTGTDALGR